MSGVVKDPMRFVRVDYTSDGIPRQTYATAPDDSRDGERLAAALEYVRQKGGRVTGAAVVRMSVDGIYDDEVLSVLAVA